MEIIARYVRDGELLRLLRCELRIGWICISMYQYREKDKMIIQN